MQENLVYLIEKPLLHETSTLDLNVEISFIDKRISSIKNTMRYSFKVFSSNHLFDNLFQDKESFSRLMLMLKTENYSNFQEGISPLVFSEYTYTITHVLYFLGKTVELKVILSHTDFRFAIDGLANPIFIIA